MSYRLRETPESTGTATILIAIILAAGLSVSGCAGEPDKPTGVILISLDTLRADHLSCYGYHRPTSPFVDSLAENGVLFENTVVQVPGTLPSHMSMLTGLLPAEHGVLPPDGYLSKEIPLLQEILASAGFRTAGFTEGGYVSGRFGFSRGFEIFDDSALKLNTDIEDVFEHGLGFLDSLEEGEPFFLFLHSYATHDPYYPPPPYTSMYFTNPDSAPQKGFHRFPADGLRIAVSDPRQGSRERFSSTVELIRNNLPAGAVMPTGPNLVAVNRGRAEAPTLEAIEFYTALYDATINYVDDVLRSLFFRLEEMGLRDETLVIITSDHGEEFFEHRRLVHQQVYHECLHVPLLMVGPGVAAGRREAQLVMSIDLTPTLLDLLGFPNPPPMSGRSLTSVLGNGKSEIEPRDAYASNPMNPSEALYRIQTGEVNQVVSHPVLTENRLTWISREIELESYGNSLTLEIKSFHTPRTVEVISDDLPATTADVGTEWQPLEIALDPTREKHSIILRSAGCQSPADVSDSPDKRCLAFAIQSFPATRTELFNLTRDPRAAHDLSWELPDIARELIVGFDPFHRSPVADQLTSELDEETAQRLRELGYIQ